MSVFRCSSNLGLCLSRFFFIVDKSPKTCKKDLLFIVYFRPISQKMPIFMFKVITNRKKSVYIDNIIEEENHLQATALRQKGKKIHTKHKREQNKSTEKEWKADIV